MCNNSGSNVVITTLSSNPEYKNHEIIKCGECASLYYAGEDPVLGYENEAMNQNYWLHYCQIGAGLTAMLEPLFYLGERARGSLLDVGCGFGYVVDFYNKIGYGDAIGLETAAYGKVGANLLGAPIIDRYYADCNEIKGKRFDIIFSCEVLEHVPNPKGFIEEISAGLEEDGILVITTPSSNVIHTNAKESELIGSLSPDYHYFLASPEALENLLKACGYKNVRVDDSGSRLYAWASRTHLPILKKQIPWQDYFEYLEILSENADPNVKTGALQRLFKDAWNTGHVEIAVLAYKKLEEYALKNYNLSFKYPDIRRYNNRKSIIREIEKNPAWYPSVLYFGGKYSGRILKDKKQKVRMWDAALEIVKNEISCLDPRLVQESQHLLPYISRSLDEAYAELSKENLPIGVARAKKTKKCIKELFFRISRDIAWWKKNWKSRINIIQ
jgi:SAM-dependent methyltransferase